MESMTDTEWSIMALMILGAVYIYNWSKMINSFYRFQRLKKLR